MIDPYRIQLKKIFGSSISLELDSISKIEFESNKYPRANWDMLYLYSGERIYEYNITSFNKRKLLNALVEICEINGIAIDTAKLKLSRFELI